MFVGRVATVQNLLDRATKYADMTNSEFFSTAQKIDLLNGLYPALYDLLVSANENYYATSTSFAIGGGQPYSLPEDFYKIIGVDFQIGGTWSNVYPFNEGERNRSFSNTSVPAGTIRLRYVPLPPIFTTDDLETEIDGVSGWDELTVLDLAIAMLDAEESSTTSLEKRRARVEARIAAMAQNRDLGMPSTVTDVEDQSYYNLRNSVRYRLYGSTIEFISVEFTGGWGFP